MKLNLQRGVIMALMFLATGCVTNQPWIANFHESAPIPANVITLWDARIHNTQDVANGGRPLPGLAGRLYLMDPNFKPEKGDGKLSVELYDISNQTPGAEPQRLEGWQLDAPTLAKLLKKDEKLGWGYSLFMPWPGYRPEITRVQINVCYMPANGYPMYAEPTPISLRNQITSTHTQKVVAQNGPAPTK